MKRILTISFVLIMIFSLSACKKTSDLTLDIESDFLGSTYNSEVEANTDENEPTVSEGVDSATDEEASHNQSNTAPDNDFQTSSTQSTSESSSQQVNTVENGKTQSQVESSSKQESNVDSGMTMRQKMVGTWRFTIPENTLPDEGFIYPGYRLVYDLMISTDNEIILSEKQFKQSDTETVGEVEYFDGKRYTLMYNSLELIQGSFSGEISISSENEAVFELYGYETQTGRFYIEETHWFTLIDDTHLQWSKSEIHSEWLDEKYFPWDSSTVFTKK